MATLHGLVAECRERYATIRVAGELDVAAAPLLTRQQQAEREPRGGAALDRADLATCDALVPRREHADARCIASIRACARIRRFCASLA